MTRISSPWSALRPLLLAGAAAATWLTLSATAATADSGADSSSLLGGVTSSVSSVTHTLSETVAPAPEVSGAQPTAPGLLQPAVTQVSGLADDLIAAVPVVEQVVPAGSVSAVSAPLSELADGVTAGVVESVVAPAAESVPILEPVLQPVSDLLTGTAPLPLPLPELPVGAVPAETVPAELPSAANPAPSRAESEAQEATTDAATAEIGTGNARQATTPAAAPAGTLAARTAVSLADGPASEQPVPPVDPSPLPGHAPAAPASGTGVGGSSGGPSSAAAWIDPFDFVFERPGAVLAGDAPEHAPAPVSFDPGSSPD